MWFWRIVIGLLVIALGLSMVWKTDFYLRALGMVSWAERNLGGGGTRLFYKLLGILIIFVGMMITTNLFDKFMTWLVGGLFG
ncbi:hypothetical protein CO057_01155 [Candidatus Uhrbacteria bacterium CG_4_9_14_0_2_um_filter_41_50]|uniref:Uncharacterized protein n=1 Tax=Candidatus Uhrbacteria bacterium CG_4_9_14_0_2_um_filter_41_50 TaxID=1975031 RepID=A0A2M8EPY9_9BACT|nr:MAG: hypothetical protein COZ45_02920 [Candidatus Uhrbacteria bacterium CG_4_10_14_3_um_filter_41_21]PIZ54298.1 MAG: hypothetical protein COY24_04220 [Candidatus Uhrbacteria bacterium CG_4_10_14_0_2_um_filter_41_21]PJB85053.1 MAG: hypothetical protein CO086_00280 [Candidatus Uhrbacteria bacterium CG_4_9_14_0_8_um_filter_41_16]PJC24761.1 MAG: hypothetical protein CO057_01155 [Candidatus Uhrbacteria bacterium CG_4_9_14_0_2_um_filter_41_50]PJE75362.1 MAG: hypothetical protein COV03_00575 [Candi